MQQDNALNKVDQGINVVDLVVYLASKWIWYIFFILIFGGLAYYQYAKSPFVYFRQATVIIKDPSNKTMTTSMDRFDKYINKVNLSNELLQFRSQYIMRKVVGRLHADVNYQIKEGLRTVELYNRTPVLVSFKNVRDERYIAFDMTIKDSKSVTLSNIEGLVNAKASYTVKLNDSISIKGERMMFTSTDYQSKSWIGQTIHVAKLPLNAVANSYRANFGIRQASDEASIITLSLKDANATRADDILNTLITVYNEDAIEDKNQVAVNTANFINERLIIIEKELSGVENELVTFKQENDIVDLGTATSQYVAQSSSYGTEAVEQATQQKVAEYVKEYLTDPTKSRELIPSNSGIGDAEIESQISQYNALKLKRDRLAADSSDENPVVEELNKAMHDLRQSVVRAVDNKIVSINVKRRDALSQQYQAQARVRSMPVKEKQMLSIERQQGIKESLYLYLLNKREENALSQAMADNNARVIDSADGSSAPIAPIRNRVVLMGIAIGAAIPTIIFLLILFMDTSVHSRKDITGKVSIPFLGEIPEDKEHIKEEKKRKKNRKSEDFSVTEQGQGMISEAFRILRTNMAFMGKRDVKTQVITFTSFNAGAGKTFTSRNLAMSLVYARKKVIMVDLDIRKGTLTRHMKHNKIGMTSYLSETSVGIDDIIYHNEDLGMDIISAGPIAPNPAELLMDERLDELMVELRQRYDYIIVDNVPVGVVADAAISNRISDLTLFVVRAGKLDKRQIPDLENIYKEGKLKNMALILNGVDPKYRGYGYRYGYGYGYGYGNKYGYGDTSSSKKKKKKE